MAGSLYLALPHMTGAGRHYITGRAQAERDWRLLVIRPESGDTAQVAQYPVMLFSGLAAGRDEFPWVRRSYLRNPDHGRLGPEGGLP